MTTPTLELPEPDHSGSTFDRYHLVRRLGVGGMGAVYEAEHTELRKRCAVKMLRQELAQNELFRRRFLREARAASAVAHPHVVDISDFGQTPDGQVYFVMELLQGRELQSLLDEQRRLPWPRTREILLQVTSALEAAHRLGVIHRDVKPANCFLVDLPGLGGEDFVKVLDFGIAKVSSKLDESTKQLTSTQEIFGTVAYMAPEMAMGTSDDPRSDIYSLGVMMYRMLVGELPFSEGNAFQILSQHVSEHPPRPREKVPSIPEAVEAIILKAMAKKPGDRFASMEALAMALRRGSVGEDEPLELQATVLGLHPLGSEGSGPIRLEKTVPLPSDGVVVDATPRAGSGPFTLHASESGTTSILDEPTRTVTPTTSPRVEPTAVLEASSPVVAKVAARVEPTAVLEASPAAAGPARDAPPTLAVARTAAEPTLARRKRSWLWVALPAVGLVAAAASAMVLLDGSKDETPAVAAAQTRPVEGAPGPSEPEPPPPKVVPAELPSTVVSTAAPEPTAVVEPEPAPAVEPAPAPPEPTPPEPTPAAKAKPKSAPKTSGSSDAVVTKRLKAKILDECRFEMGGRQVTVSFVVTPSGGISLLTASPKNEGAQCAKEQVAGTTFSPRSESTPVKIVVR